ncbi:MAG: hypothetical protein HQL15_05760 [Candidatus Omnitrophica bacterium]|nr:hypothetical protein [Candidatus Omnitrophota bacterium]
MNNRWIGVFVVSIFLTAVAYADGMQGYYDVIARMKTTLQLTDAQYEAIKPIMKEDMQKRQKLLNEQEGEPIKENADTKRALRKIKEETNAKLSKVLSEEQMKKLIEKERIRESLNKDKLNYADNLISAVGFNAEGGSFGF